MDEYNKRGLGRPDPLPGSLVNESSFFSTIWKNMACSSRFNPGILAEPTEQNTYSQRTIDCYLQNAKHDVGRPRIGPSSCHCQCNKSRTLRRSAEAFNRDGDGLGKAWNLYITLPSQRSIPNASEKKCMANLIRSTHQKVSSLLLVHEAQIWTMHNL